MLFPTYDVHISYHLQQIILEKGYHRIISLPFSREKSGHVSDKL